MTRLTTRLPLATGWPPRPSDRRWLHLDADAAARDHARCEAVLRCLAGGTALAACRAPAQP